MLPVVERGYGEPSSEVKARVKEYYGFDHDAVAANSNNGAGVTGINWNAKILPIRVLGKCGGYMSDIFDATRWAAGLPVCVDDNGNPISDPSVKGNPANVETFDKETGVWKIVAWMSFSRKSGKSRIADGNGHLGLFTSEVLQLYILVHSRLLPKYVITSSDSAEIVIFDSDTATAGITNVARSAATAVSPAISGFAFSIAALGAPFLLMQPGMVDQLIASASDIELAARVAPAAPCERRCRRESGCRRAAG